MTSPVSTPISGPSGHLDNIVFGADGLVPAIIQEAQTNAVLMFAWMNSDALARTLETGRTWLWSRSRQEYWCKGETSGNQQYVRDVRYDCDADVLLVLVDQAGDGACHTGQYTCFYRSFTDETVEANA